MTVEGQLQKSTTTYPHKWVQSSEQEVKRARAKHVDAARLRGAIGNVINDSKTTGRDMEQYLRGAVAAKIHSTEKIMNSLMAELAGVQREMGAAAQRQSELEVRP
jgi:hypothetical protein